MSAADNLGKQWDEHKDPNNHVQFGSGAECSYCKSPAAWHPHPAQVKEFTRCKLEGCGKDYKSHIHDIGRLEHLAKQTTQFNPDPVWLFEQYGQDYE